MPKLIEHPQPRIWLPQTFAHLMLFAIIILGYGLSGCSNSGGGRSGEPQPAVVANSPAVSKPLLQVTPMPSPTNQTATPPSMKEVSEAVARVFDKSATLIPDRPLFLVGDFNGDGSQDLAVLTKTTGDSLAEINSELANWILEDPHEVPVPGTKAAAELAKPKPVKAGAEDWLLAIIHGVGPQGWRNPDARQTYLLKKAADPNATVRRAADLTGSFAKSKLPLRGDTILETINGRQGLIFWTGAAYAWAPQS